MGYAYVCLGETDNAEESWKKGKKNMRWVLGLTATAAVFVAGVVGLACVAVCKISQCRLD